MLLHNALKYRADKCFEYRISVRLLGTLLFMVKNDISDTKLQECVGAEEKLASVLISIHIIINSIPVRK